MKTKFSKSIMGMSLILSTLVTTNSASSNMNGFEDCRRASTDELNAMRGGFLINADGMQFLLSLGIERITYVNGALVAMSTFNLLPQLNSSQLRQSLLSQLGTGNMQQISPASLPATAAIGPAPSPAQMSVAPVPASASVAPMTPTPSVASVTAFSPTPSTASPSSTLPPVASTSPAPSTASAAPTVAQNAPPPILSATAPSTGNFQPIQVIQIGPRNTFTPPSATNPASGTMAVIQNTLDNQLIRNMTIINATLATRELLRSTALSAALSRIPANFGR